MNTIKTLKSISNRVILPLLLLAPVIAGAATPVRDPNASKIGVIPDVEGTFRSRNFIDTIELVIRWALGFIGIFVFLIFLFAGFEYATSGGDDAKAGQARTRMVNAIIGLIIIFFAFVASNTILSFVFQDVGV
jgi:amino acid transporter